MCQLTVIMFPFPIFYWSSSLVCGKSWAFQVLYVSSMIYQFWSVQNCSAMLSVISLSPTSFWIPIELQEGLQLDLTHRLGIPSPYDKRSADLQFYMNGLKMYWVPDQLATKEAAGIFKAWMNKEALHTCEFSSHCYCHLQKSWHGAFVHHPVFWSSHCENWVWTFLMYIDHVNRLKRICMHNLSIFWACWCDEKDRVLAPPNLHREHWYGYQSSPIINTEVQGPVLGRGDTILK